jgi:hypothetical protein
MTRNEARRIAANIAKLPNSGSNCTCRLSIDRRGERDFVLPKRIEPSVQFTFAIPLNEARRIGANIAKLPDRTTRVRKFHRV